MSIRAKIAVAMIKSMNMKEIFNLPDDKLIEKVNKMNQKRGLKCLKLDDRCKDELIMNKYHCIRVLPHSGNVTGAVMFIFGGGNMVDCDNGDLDAAKKIADIRNVEVWFPLYPLVPSCSIRESVEMVYTVYSKMLEIYSSDQISILGFSSGGAQALILCEYNNAAGRTLPMPRQIIAVSPGSCNNDASVQKRAKQLSEKDAMIPASFLDTAKRMMTKNDKNIPEYMISPDKGDLSGVPMIHFIYGENETLYAMAPEFESACQQKDVPYTLTVGKNMFHCYPMLTFYPEGKQGFEEILSYI
ncbi:MAG: alpha/beta hydrolase [Lachnospiraceae bacterium]|nr:alpha/beta hydrolase [Lachnospiraceae bacterium]